LATFGGRGPRWLRKAGEWCARYLPAEIVGTVCAVIGAYVAFRIMEDRAVAAISGTLAENVGFYGVMTVTEWRRQAAGRPGLHRRAGRTAAVLFAEFGPAEALDSLLVRPVCMYLGPFVTGGIASGSLLGKLIADAVFYAVAIVSYEFVQRRFAPAGATVTAVSVPERTLLVARPEKTSAQTDTRPCPRSTSAPPGAETANSTYHSSF
jgi:hypothetical protein